MRLRKIVLLAVLVCVPMSLSLLVPLYNSAAEFYGIPFFYWFQIILLMSSTGFYLAYSFIIDNTHKAK